MEPFFMLNLEITRDNELESCLESFFEIRPLTDYKTEDNKEESHRKVEFKPKGGAANSSNGNS